MIADWSSAALVLLPVLFGVVVGAVPAAMVERSRHRVVLNTRWDAALQGTCASFAASARALLDLGEQVAEVDGDDQRAALERMRLERGRLQVLMAEVRILADEPVQLAARRVVRHTWAMQVMATTGVDPRAGDFPVDTPQERSLASLFDFYRAVRRQLRIPGADDLAPLNPPIERGSP